MNKYENYDPWTYTRNDVSVAMANFIATQRQKWTYDLLEKCPEEVAIMKAEDHEVVKDHDLYFIDFGTGIGYSVMVYYNHHTIRYACDYSYHHEDMSKEKLHAYYMEKLTQSLYTDEELASPITDYSDYKRRDYYLTNYYGDREDFVSYYHIFNYAEVEKAYRDAVKTLWDNPICHGNYKSREFVEKCYELHDLLEKARAEKLKDYDYLKDAFLYEYKNYECIFGHNYIEAVGAVVGSGKMTDVQQRAANAAKREYFKWCDDRDLI